MNSDSTLLRCSHCRAVNRVKIARLSESPVCGSCHEKLIIPSSPVHTDSAGFKTAVLDEPGLVLLVFWAPYCGYCRALDPILETTAKKLAGRIKIVKVNTQTDAGPAEAFGVRGIPALFLIKGGRKVSEKAGMMGLDPLLRWIEEYV